MYLNVAKSRNIASCFASKNNCCTFVVIKWARTFAQRYITTKHLQNHGNIQIRNFKQAESQQEVYAHVVCDCGRQTQESKDSN